MGFGLIFTGYIALLFFKVLPPAMLAGAYLMYRGLRRMNLYGKPFVRAKNAAAALCGYFALYTALWIGSLAGVLGGLFKNDVFVLCDDILYYALLLVFHICLYAALEAMARECGYEKGIKNVYFARVLTAMFYVLTAARMVTSFFASPGYLPFACLVCQLVWLLYTAALLYGFYMRISTDEILEDEERKIAAYNARFGGKRR